MNRPHGARGPSDRRGGGGPRRGHGGSGGPGGGARGFGGPPRHGHGRPRDSGRDRGPRRFDDRRPAGPNTRALALEALLRLDASRTLQVPECLDQVAGAAQLDGREQRFLQELVYGVLRHRMTLDCVIAAFTRGSLGDVEDDCLQVLRMGVYQLFFLDAVPPFAAVSESVNLMRRRHEGVQSMVNGVLRSIARDANKVDVGLDRGGASPQKRVPVSDKSVVFLPRAVFCDPADNLALHLGQVYSQPPFLVERWLKKHDRAVVEEILASGNRRPQVSARVNRAKIDREGLARRLLTEHVTARVGILPESLIFDVSAREAVHTRAFEDGLFYLQDEAAMKVAPALDPKPGERILDLCAAPGGKATHLAELTGDQATIVAVDRDAERLALVADNCRRLGVKSVTPFAFDLLEHDTTQPLPEPLRAKFDAVLIDVPCSNTGVLARRPEVRWRVSEPAIVRLAEQARRLLSAAVPLVRHGGRIVFSTCSLETEENEGAVERALVANPGLILVSQSETLPSQNGPDGGFLAVFDVGVGRSRAS